MAFRRPELFEHSGLIRVLQRSRDLGFLGPPTVQEQVLQALAMGSCLERVPETFLDLGSGGGLPGLVLAVAWPDAEFVLLDVMHRRCQFLREALDELEMGRRAVVVEGRAEELARRQDLRERFDVVFARSFARPAVTAECGAAFVKDNGWLVVSEPPGETRVWPEEELCKLSLGEPLKCSAERSVVKFRKTGSLDERWPRKIGVPTKRPLWSVPSAPIP